MARMISDLHLGPPADRSGVPLRIDLITVYDRRRLEPIAVTYADGEVDRLTAYRFRPAAPDPEAVLAVVIIDW